MNLNHTGKGGCKKSCAIQHRSVKLSEASRPPATNHLDTDSLLHHRTQKLRSQSAGQIINCHYLHLACGYCCTFGKHLCCTCEDMPQLHAFRYVLCPCSLQITSSACIMLQTLATDMARPSPVALFGASGKLSASHLLLLSTNFKNALKHLETFSNTRFHQLRLSRVGASRVSCAIRTSKAIPASGQQPLRRVTYWQDWTENSSQ